MLAWNGPFGRGNIHGNYSADENILAILRVSQLWVTPNSDEKRKFGGRCSAEAARPILFCGNVATSGPCKHHQLISMFEQ